MSKTEVNMHILLNREPLEFAVSKFSGGEMHFTCPYLEQITTPFNAEIEVSLHSSDAIMALLLATDALRRAGCKAIRLCIPYLPYARQDRVCNRGEALSLRVIADILNAQKYFEVVVWDAHSDVALALIDRSRSVPVVNLMTSYFDWDHLVLVAPDAGSIKKVATLSKTVGAPFVRADKSRDPKTMEITGTVVYSDHIGQKDFLIVDDICDGGRTFIALAAALRPLTSGKILLYITHGIFSYGTGVFDGIIDEVYVANSFVENLPNNFHLTMR